jgi:type II secretion system protein C
MVTVKMDRLTGLANVAQHYLIADNRLIILGEIALVIAIAIALADMVSGMIAPTRQDLAQLDVQTTQDGDTSRAPGAIVNMAPSSSLLRLFGTASTGSSNDDPGFIEAQVQETQLNLVLKGILVNGENGKRLALIAEPGQSEEVYQEGDDIEGAEIIRIETRRVILRRNGRTEALSLEIRELGNASRTQRQGLRPGRVTSGIRRISDRERVIPRETFSRQLNNLPRLLQQASAVPHTENGQAMGFRLVTIQSGSIFEELGLQRDDFIRSVNGRQILSVEDALNSYRDLRASRSFQVGLLRGGRQLTLNLSVQ